MKIDIFRAEEAARLTEPICGATVIGLVTVDNKECALVYCKPSNIMGKPVFLAGNDHLPHIEKLDDHTVYREIVRSVLTRKTQAALAGEMNVSVVTVQSWSAGRRTPTTCAIRLLLVASKVLNLEDM